MSRSLLAFAAGMAAALVTLDKGAAQDERLEPGQFFDHSAPSPILPKPPR